MERSSKLPVGDLLAGSLAIGLQGWNVLLGLLKGLIALLKPLLAVDGHFPGLGRVLGEDVFDGIDEEAAGAAGGVVDRVAEVGIHHFDHHGADLARRAELTVQGRLAKVGQQVLEDVALDVRAELSKLDAVDLVDHLLEHVRVDDFQHGVAEVLGDLRLLFDQRGHVRKDFVAHEVAQVRATLEAPLGPAVALGLLREEQLARCRSSPRSRAFSSRIDSSSSSSFR